MNKIFLIIPLFSLALYAGEPSAFGAGNIDSDNPYGLTENEKYILTNKKNLENINRRSTRQNGDIKEVTERIDGIQKIVEGLLEKSHKNKINIQVMKKNSSSQNTIFEARYEEYLKKENNISSSILAHENNIIKLKEVLTEFSGMINDINTNYVSKDEYNKLVGEVNDLKLLVLTQFKALNKKPDDSFKGKNKSQIAKEARAYFDKKNYDKAIVYYDHLNEINYKPARANYMLGEMYYYRKSYDNAIAYFKKSAELYAKASYMPILMLHMAVSMDKTSDVENAQNFYKAIIATYPKSKYAKQAKKRLK